MQSDAVPAGRGRPAGRLAVAHDDGVVVGVDLGGHHAIVVLMSAAGDILDRSQTPVDLAVGPAGVLEIIAGYVTEMSLAEPMRSRVLAEAVRV
jgi:predicted NBD/HSP70 family sugar kinase